MAAAPQTDGPVKTRRVHYISGFDPRGARYYHRLYREEAAKQAPHLGTDLEVGDRVRINSRVSSWTIRGTWDFHTVDTEYQFMSWDDLVRDHWDASLAKVCAKITPSFFRSLAYWSMFRRVLAASRQAWYTSVLPMAFLLAMLVGIPALSAAAGALTQSAGWLLCSLVMVATALASLHFALKLGNHLGVFWVARTFIFIVKWGHSPRMPDLEERADQFARHILSQQQTDPVDEVLIVGHSVGSMFSTVVLARLLEISKSSHLPPGFNFLTIGACIPYLTLIPTAAAFRRDLQTLADDDRIPWTDITIPPDPLCFFQTNPILASGLSCPFLNRPRLFGARIFRMFSRETYRQFRWNKLRIHFQYLMASELPNDYDYFRLTAGPERLTCSVPGSVL